MCDLHMLEFSQRSTAQNPKFAAAQLTFSTSACNTVVKEVEGSDSRVDVFGQCFCDGEGSAIAQRSVRHLQIN